jgi:hypothetical protein
MFSSSRALRTSTGRLPVKIQPIENWAELRISPVKIQPIEDWAEPRSVENVQQFPSFANLYREVAGKDTANRGLGCAEKRQEPSAVLGLRRKASRMFRSSRALRTSTARSPVKIQPIEDWAAPRSVKNPQQFWGFAEKRQERSAVLGPRGLLLPLY